MPHSTVATRDAFGRRVCPYCGRPVPSDRWRRAALTCDAHRDLPALEPLDDRFTLTEDAGRGDA